MPKKRNVSSTARFRILRPAVFTILSALIVCSTLGYDPAAQKNSWAPAKFSTAAAAENTDGLSQDQETPAFKDETVYALLDYDGNVLKQRLVNRIYGCVDQDAKYVVDYGKYTTLENMTSGEKPVRIEGNRVIWDSALLQAGDLYYEGVIEQRLPVDFTITYYLDGKRISAADLAGKSGHLEVIIKAKNNLEVQTPVEYRDYYGNPVMVHEQNYVPLLVQGTCSVDLNLFSNIEADNASMIITGQTASINFMVFPYPEAEITLSMDGEGISFDKIMLMIVPGLPPLTDIDLEEDLVQMVEGLNAIGDGLKQLEEGAGLLLEGLEKFRDESERMENMADQAARLFEDFLALFDEPPLEELAELIRLLRELMEKLESLPDPAAVTAQVLTVSSQSRQLENKQQALNKESEALAATSAAILAEAERMVAENEAGSELHALGRLLLLQHEQVSRIVTGSQDLQKEASALKESASALESVWLNEYQSRLTEIQGIAWELEEQLHRFCEFFTHISEALSQLEENACTLIELMKEIEKMYADLAQLPGAFEQMVEGQTKLKNGLKDLRRQGVIPMREGIAGGLNEIRYGQAKLQLMREIAEGYRSFADNERNRHSTVQFILQTGKIEITQGINRDQNEQPKDESNTLLQNLWSRFLALFKVGK